MFTDLFTEVFAELFEVEVPQPFAPPAEPVAFTGFGPWDTEYENTAFHLAFSVEDDQPMVTISMRGELAAIDPNPVQKYRLIPAEDRLYALQFQGAEQFTPLMFFTLADGTKYVHFGGRATPSIG